MLSLLGLCVVPGATLRVAGEDARLQLGAATLTATCAGGGGAQTFFRSFAPRELDLAAANDLNFSVRAQLSGYIPSCRVARMRQPCASVSNRPQDEPKLFHCTWTGPTGSSVTAPTIAIPEVYVESTGFIGYTFVECVGPSYPELVRIGWGSLGTGELSLRCVANASNPREPFPAAR